VAAGSSQMGGGTILKGGMTKLNSRPAGTGTFLDSGGSKLRNACSIPTKL